MAEVMVLSILGGAAGVVIAGLLLRLLIQSSEMSLLATQSHGHLTASVDARVCAAALLLTVLSALLFGMIPARHVSQSSPLQAMKSGPVDSVRLRRFTLRDLLLGAQIAICMLLVTASLVAVRGMVRMFHTPLGFQPQGAMLAEIDFSEMEERGDALLKKQKAMLEAVQRIPGVTAAGAVNRIPFTGGLRGVPIFPIGTTDFNLNNSVLAPYVFTMSPGYLGAAGTRLLSGRDVSWHDTKTSPYVAIVNRAFAQKMWGETPAIGQRFILQNHLMEVVGVAEDGKYYQITDSHQPAVFLPLLQTENGVRDFAVRSQRTQQEMAAALERTLTDLEPDAQVAVQSWPDAIADTFFPARAATVALGVMGLLASMLAVTGIFGMAAYNVSRRMKELGIRVALGARSRHVINAAVGRPIVLLGIGSVVGLLSGVFASRLLGQIVYQANPRDPLILVGAVLTMALLGMAASAIPALRALAIDPSKLLREE
jgi:predicted permease